MDDLDNDIEVNRKSYELQERVLHSLNIVYNEANSFFVFWNKYQLFIFEDINFENEAKVFVPEFQIQKLLVSNNYLVCLDCSGNIHINSLKFKNAAQKRFKSSFQPREQGILSNILYNSDVTLSLKRELEDYFLCLHRINIEFSVDKKVILKFNAHDSLPQIPQTNPLIYSHPITQDNFEQVNDIFKANDNIWKEHRIILISLDKRAVFGCLFSHKMTDDDLNLVELYRAPSEICDIKINEVEDLTLLIALKSGSLIKMQLKNPTENPEVIHLNAALHKVLVLKDSQTVIYTDGVTMWKSQNTFTKNDIKFELFFVKQCKDFIKVGDEIICTTFSNLIYTFCIEHESSYIKPTTEEYCSAETLLNNSEYLYEIMLQVKKNGEVINKLNEESNYITALALSQRQDIIDQVIKYKIIVYEHYQDVITENSNINITLTEEFHEYFKCDTILFLIKITAFPIIHTLSNILSNLFGDLKIHITFSSEGKQLKTTSMKLTEPLKRIELLLTLSREEMLNKSELNVEIKLVSDIPGSLDEGQKIWTTLYRKEGVLTSEHLVKTKSVENKISNLKEPQDNIEKLILETAIGQYGNLFKFTDISMSKSTNAWKFYVKLPNNYIEIFRNENIFKEYLNKNKAIYFLQQLNCDDFLKSKAHIVFEIGKDEVKIQIENDEFSDPILKVSSFNIKIAFNIRNYFSSLFYKHSGSVAGEEYVNYALYTTTENLQKAMRECIAHGSHDRDEFLSLFEQFQKNIIGALPL